VIEELADFEDINIIDQAISRILNVVINTDHFHIILSIIVPICLWETRYYSQLADFSTLQS